MPTSRKVLCAVYAAISLAALVATWSQNLEYFGGGSPVSGFADFWQDTRANPAAQSITVDIALFMLAAMVFMVIEARRHHIRFVWAYILASAFIAISVTFPLFLIAREARLAQSNDPLPRLATLDRILLIALAAGLAAFVLWVDLA